MRSTVNSPARGIDIQRAIDAGGLDRAVGSGDHGVRQSAGALIVTVVMTAPPGAVSTVQAPLRVAPARRNAASTPARFRLGRAH